MTDYLEQVLAHGLGELGETMGIEILEASPTRMVARMPVAGNRQPYGLLHGGASVVLAETLGSMAAALHGGPEKVPVGIEVSAAHHRERDQRSRHGRGRGDLAGPHAGDVRDRHQRRRGQPHLHRAAHLPAARPSGRVRRSVSG